MQFDCGGVTRATFTDVVVKVEKFAETGLNGG
jgi:hypothetical protein